ncbi:MAG: GyrI-like domain-containing protein [Anaerolineae bacterium]|nr:GyrI-like domain-containing protein [Anaerolineae bacterium]
MIKVDFKKELKHLYNPPKKFDIVDVPEMQFLMVDGHGDPNTAQAYKDAIETLYAVAYTLKFSSKNGLEKDYVVPPLEGLWWTENMETFAEDKSQWDWTAMIMTPTWITQELFEDAVAQVRAGKNPAALDLLRLATYTEGQSAQIMYLGAYADEGPTIAAMHEFIKAQGYMLRGKHHEIYISDPRRTAPEKLKTVIRQPIQTK